MHAVLAITLMYDTATALDPASSAAQTQALAYHWCRTVSMFHAKLSQPLLDAEKDAVWSVAVLVSVGSSIGPASAQSQSQSQLQSQFWPLKASAPDDLLWLQLHDSKKIVWHEIEPLRQGGAMEGMAQDLVQLQGMLELSSDGADEAWESLPRGFVTLFELDGDFGNGPYCYGLKIVAEMYREEREGRQNRLLYMAFLSPDDSRLRCLLGQKDPRALLLLLYWYAKVCVSKYWWLKKRSIMEGLAICEYLRRLWGGRREREDLLEGPLAALSQALSEFPVIP
jgi:hypothetical protein